MHAHPQQPVQALVVGEVHVPGIVLQAGVERQEAGVEGLVPLVCVEAGVEGQVPLVCVEAGVEGQVQAPPPVWAREPGERAGLERWLLDEDGGGVL